MALEVSGAKKEHVIAFARIHDGAAAITVVPRLSVRLTGTIGAPPLNEVWGDTTISLPAALRGIPLRNIFTGEELDDPAIRKSDQIPITSILHSFPVALLCSPGPRAPHPEFE